ncbi:uncharacterized protein DUF4189 [Luteibacter sp. OK325]|uniref:DUF4189 domain-containing protein n=1 Tax=Luteibacter sp. OK325 TaxID=2135670 RepID=UPI000D3C2209|nr:DUF4189 domain-containing protein [Luteibacter sp. OK325]PTR30928.1 uncharacterized protein DUF4189 [Luteibacter sp. OK325]
MVNPRISFLGAFAFLMAFPAMSKTAEPTPSAPAEIVASAPQGTHLLAFKASGDQVDADAVAVFETPPDKDGVTYRDLIIFGKKDGKFAPEVSSDKIIACSKCSQFHDDPFMVEGLDVKHGHIHIDQEDGGEKPTTTIIDLTRQSGEWHVKSASRHIVVMGRYEERTVVLPLPKSGLAKDMDAEWAIPVYLNTLIVNQKTGKSWILTGDESQEAVWKHMVGRCDKQDCKILVQQQDGCISLVRDESSRPFSGASSDNKEKKQAVSQAMDACNAAGGKACKEVDTQCRRGI